MRPNRIQTLLLGLLIGALPALGFELKPGDPLPSLTLPTAREKKLTSTDSFHGKKSLVFIFASW